MAFPRKFKNLIETEKEDVTTPSYAWITYCVCAVNNNSCGWAGWSLEAIFHKPNANAGDKILEAQTNQVCPVCGGETYRTGVSYRFDLSSNQSNQIDFEYDVAPIEYTEE